MFKAGDIVFVMHNDNKLSKIIAACMGSRWSHSAVVIGSYAGKTLLCETSDFEVVIADLERYLVDPRCDVEIYRSDSENDDSFRINHKAFSLIGQMYGYLQLLSLGLRRLARLVGLEIPNLITSGIVCCAVVVSCLQNTSLDLGIDPKQLDTEDLYQMIIANHRFKKIYG